MKTANCIYMKNALKNSAFSIILKNFTASATKLVMLVAMVCACSGVWGQTNVIDYLNYNLIGVTGNNYASWTDIRQNSAAVYAGMSAGGNTSIQMRTDNNNSGIITTASGGTAKKVTVTWNTNTSNGRTIDIYGKTTPYSSASDLYSNSDQGTKIGSIVYGTSTELTITGNYTYIGIRSSNRPLYLDEIQITWQTASAPSSTTCPVYIYWSKSNNASGNVRYTYTNGNGILQTGTSTTFSSNSTVDVKTGTTITIVATKTSKNGNVNIAANYDNNAGSEIANAQNNTAYGTVNCVALTTYTVTYDANGATGGSVPASPTSYASGTTVTVLGNTGSLVKTGYTFNGWNTAANGSGQSYAAGATFSISANTTLYAQWADAGSTPCTPTWSSTNHGYISNFSVTQGGSSLLNSSSTGTANSNTDYYSSRSITASAGSTIDLSITPSESDTYGFAVWVDFDADGMETSDRVLYTSSYGYSYSGSYTIPANTPAGEYRIRILQDWSTLTPSDPCGSYNYGESEDYKLIVTAPVYYNVTYNGNGSTGGTPPTDANSYLPGASATVLGNTGSLVKTGYTFGGWNTRADGNGTTYAAGDNLTVSGNTTLYALWLSPYTVTWSIDGHLTAQNYPIGNSYALTVPSGVATDATSYNCYERVFVGWTANSSYSSDNPPADLFRTPSGNVSANVTYYAVFAYESGSPATWELVNNVSELAVGDKVVIAASGYDYAISTTQNSNNRAQAEITKSVSAITWTSSVCEFDLRAGTTSGTWAFYDAANTGYIYAASSSSNYLRTQATNDANGSWAISISSGIASITAQGSNTNNQLKYNNGSSLFSCYASGQQAVAIYKKVSSYYGYSTSCTPCTDPTFSLPSASGIVNMGGTLSISLTNPNNTEVTWTSSNPSIATVSGTNTGATITGVNHGSATITASIRAANVSGTYYCPATVTYNVTVACATIMLPVCFDFEDYASPNSYVSTDAGLPTCWNRVYSGSNSGYAPHVFNGTYAMDDNGIVITSGSASTYGSTNYVVMPFIDGLHEDDIIRFNAWCESSSYGTLTFGYMTDPSNAATFNSIGTATAEYYSGGSASTGQNEFTIPAAMPLGTYLAFKWYYNSSLYYSVVIDNICIEHACTPIPGTLTLTTSSGSILAPETLDISGYVNNGIDQTTYPGTLSYISSNDNVATVSAAGVITGVAEGSATIFVRYTPDDIDQCAKTAEFTVVVTDGCARVGNGTSYNYYAPVYSSSYYDDYSYTQQIYTASEIAAAGGVAGLVETLRFQYYGSSNLTIPLNVYLGQTTQSSLSSAWITDASLRQVFSGSKTFTPGWVAFDISSAGFVWDGTSNILVAVKTNSYADSDYGAYYFYYTDVTGGARYYYSSSSEVSLDGNNVPTTSGTSTSYRPNVKFCINACTQPSSGTLSLSTSSSAPLVGSTIDLGIGQGILSNTLRDGGGNAITGTYSYTPSNPSIATVSLAGVVNAVAEGSTTITVTFTPNGAYSAYCPKSVVYTVNVNDGCLNMGDESTTASSAPVYGLYKNSYSQMIYSASEIGSQGTITSIAFNAASANAQARDIEIYIGHTTKTSFSSATDFVPVSQLTRVYTESSWTIDAGWNTFDITDFDYDGTSNIVVAMYSTASAYSSTSFNAKSVSGSVIYAYSDSNDPNPTTNDGSWDSFSYTSSTSSRPFAKFCITTCTRPTGTFAFTSDVMRIANGATVNLALPANLTNTLSPSGTVTYTSSNPTVASVTNAGLVSASASAHGIAVITATFTPGNDDYCEVTARITIDVACSYSSPVCFDFEDYESSANTQYYADAGLPECWSRIYGGTYVGGEPHGYKGDEAMDGTGIIITSGIYDEYHEDFGYTNYVVMPYISGLAAGDMVSFNAWWQYINYGTLTLGYMTNPADASTFVAIDNATPFLYNFGSAAAGTNLIELPVGLPAGAYLAFKWVCQTNYFSYSVVIDNVCICSAVAGTFELTTTTGDVTAMHTLDISGYVNSTIDTNVTPGEIVYSSSNPDVATVSSEGVIMGLSEGETTIIVEFVPDNTAKCPRFATFTISVNDGCTKVGDGGTNTTYYVPVNTYYKYTYSQILYNKTELTAGLITAIGFEYAYSTAMTAKNDVKMYLVETDKTSFSGTTDWVTTVTESNLVYSGTLNCSEGWNTFDLDAPFTYSGTRNLLLVIDDNSGSYNSSSYKFKYTATGSNTVLHYYNDTYNYGNTDIDGQTADGCIANRPNTKFCIFDGALHTITYNTTANCTGGLASSIEPANVVEGQLALLSSEEPTCSTGIFLHWNTSDDDSGTPYAPGTVILVGSSDITLYAIYRICDYVSVSRNGQPAQGANDGGYDSDGYQKFNACQGSDLSLIATKKDGIPANFTSVLWDVNRHDGNAHLTSDVSTLTYTVENAMGHDILLTVEADDGCQQKIPLRVWVSHGLTMAGDSPTAGEICVGAGKEIYVGDPQVVPQSIIEVDNEAIEIKSTKGEAKRKFIPDGVGECYTSDVVFADFREDVTITDASNIDYVRINLEHSFIADMQISLKCYTPEHEERTAILLQDAYDLSDGGLDNAEYDWPYIYINCFAKYKRYNNTGYSSGECTQGSYVDEVNRNVYVKYDGTTYSATGVRIECSAFDKNLTTAQKLAHLKGMINSGNEPAPFCSGEYYYVFDSWLHNADYYTTSNYASTPSSDQWSGRYIASLGFGKPNALDGLDGSQITDISYNPYGEGLDYCWSNSDSYTYADGDGNILDTVNHMMGYTNGTIVKQSDVAGGTQFYHPYQSFQSLVGCKLNGLWTIQICDSWELDNGYIFSWEIGLKNVDDNAWSYEVSLVDSHVGTCGGFDPDDRNNTENLIYEIDNEANFYIHPTLENIVTENVEIGVARNCELTLIDNLGCESTGNGFTYTVVQPTQPEIEIPAICIGEEATVTADLTAGAVAGSGSSFTWWRVKDGNKTQIGHETGITSSSLSILPTTADSIYSAEIYDAAGCGGIIDGVVTINVPDDVTDVADYNYIWHGKYVDATSTDWNTATNWILYNSGTDTYTVSSASVPTIGDNVYIGSAKCGRTNPALTAESFANDLTIASAAALNIPAGMTLNIAGDLTNTGTMTANNASTVVFKGSADQTISNAQEFGNVSFDQQAAGHIITATNGITVNNEATFTQGVLKGNATFAETASVHQPANLTYNSFVDGTVTRATSAAGEFTFPTGSGSVLGTVTASLLASSSTDVTFYHTSGTGYDMPEVGLCSDNNPHLDHVSGHEYWKVNTSTALASSTLKLSSANQEDHFSTGATTYEGEHIYGVILQGGCWKTISNTPSEVNGDHNTITISGVNIPAVATRAAEPQPMSIGSTERSTLLPIELTSFTATCDGRSSLVEWATASERNNDYFSLERSDDAINFTEIARIAGAGNSIEPLSYSYTDYGVRGGDNYYRLVQVDYDGSRTASEIIVANCVEASGDPEVLAYPNPFSGDLTVELENFGDRPASIEVYDVLGRLLYVEQADAPQNSYQTVLHLSDVPSSTYTVRVSTSDFVINRKVVKN